MLGSHPFSRKDGNKSLPPTVQTKNLLQQGKQSKYIHINKYMTSIFHVFPHFLPCVCRLNSGLMCFHPHCFRVYQMIFR